MQCVDKKNWTDTADALIQRVDWPVLLNLHNSSFVAFRARNKDKELTTTQTGISQGKVMTSNIYLFTLHKQQIDMHILMVKFTLRWIIRVAAGCKVWAQWTRILQFIRFFSFTLRAKQDWHSMHLGFLLLCNLISPSFHTSSFPSWVLLRPWMYMIRRHREKKNKSEAICWAYFP